MGREVLSQVELIDHAFFTKTHGDRGFRQALILDTETALSPFRITYRARQRVISILNLLDSLTAVLVNHWVQDTHLKRVLSDDNARRVLLFAPEEAASVFKLTPQAQDELFNLAEMANVMAEVLFGVGVET
jgi:hypothetical protein